MHLLSLALAAFTIVLAADARPQLHFSNHETQAFKSVLGRKKAISISRAVPVMAFSDSNPSKFVKVPAEKLGLAPFSRGGSDIHSAKLIGVQTDVSHPKQSFHETFGRGSAHGPIVAAGAHGFQAPAPAIHSQATLGFSTHGNIQAQGKFNPPQELHFGFKPIYDGHGQNVASFNSEVVHNVAVGNNLHLSGPVIATDVKTSLQPVIPEFSNFNLQTDQLKFDGISTGDSNGHSFQPQFETFGKLTEDNLNFDFSNLGKQQLGQFDITPEEFKGKFGSVSQVASGENLYRHHVPSSLVPTKDAGPGSKAVSKVQKNTPANQGSSVFKRTIDPKAKKNSNVIVISEHSEKSIKDRVPSTPIPKLISSELPKDLSNLKFVQQNGAIVLENPSNNKASQKQQGTFRFPTESGDEKASIFDIPELPDIQLPLQGGQVRQKITPRIPSSVNKKVVKQSPKAIDFTDESIVFERVKPSTDKNRQSKQSSSFKQNLQLQQQSNQLFKNAKQNQNQFPFVIPSSKKNNNQQFLNLNQNQQQLRQGPTIQRIHLTPEQLKLLQSQHDKQLTHVQLSQLLATSNQPSLVPSTSTSNLSNKNSGTTIVSASPPAGSVPPSVLSALGGSGGLAALGGLGGLGGGAGGQPQIIVKTLELDADDADPSSDAFKAALKKATEEARLELGVSSSEELGVGGADIASLFGKRRRKRQLFGGEDTSTAQSLGTALSTAAGLYDDNVADESDE